MVKLFYLTDNIYWKSGTAMSSIYEVDTFKRYDWGFVNRDLREGKEVNIRPANVEELRWAIDKLNSIKE